MPATNRRIHRIGRRTIQNHQHRRIERWSHANAHDYICNSVYKQAKGEQPSYLTLGLTRDLPIDTLYGLGFQQDTKMKVNLSSKRVEPALLQVSFLLFH